ncbi:ABC transporter permease [Phytomonospora endophytica]|uniref:Putative ABC transport system permease protein n=1 Tax=Phytomonospora endophytica TaxID=714109 RepID=A0A841FHF4_9ACTN|nr:ABC transporter permease [Phytomonospora endophytica]MBB6033278.1 putative ABC transport system permease protein [Phytomonospora endophytica]GIG65504.1 ABC transporter permease [Phytomonospora endophytica]
MNLFKRAWWHLRVRIGRTLLMTGLFLVICTLSLSGFLIQSAAARAADEAKRRVGAVATMELDLNALLAKQGRGDEGGGPSGMAIGAGGDLHRDLADRIGASPVVTGYNYLAEGAAVPTASAAFYRAVPPPADLDLGSIAEFFPVFGVRDTGQEPGFRNGTLSLLSGSGIAPDSTGNLALIEERFAGANGLSVGDVFTLSSGKWNPEAADVMVEFTVTGIYRDEKKSDLERYTPPGSDPGNTIYSTVEGSSRLQGKDPADGGGVIRRATFTLGNPDDLDRLKADAAAAGADLEVFPLTVNDKQYRALVGPIGETAGFATVTVWLVSVAGLVIVGLIAASSLRERRPELGVLMSLGEGKGRILGQHVVEITACALVAIALAAGVSQVLSKAVGDALLSGEVASASAEAQAEGPSLSDTSGGAGGPEAPEVAPVDRLDIRLGTGDLVKVGAAGIGIALLATVVPGIGVLRLRPREILTKGE